MRSGRRHRAGSSEAAGHAAVRRRANDTDSANPCPIDKLTDGLVNQVLSTLCLEDLRNARLAWRRFDAASRAGAAVWINAAAAAESGAPNWARFPEMTDLTLVDHDCWGRAALREALSGGGGDDAAATAASAARLAAVERLVLQCAATHPTANDRIVPTLECALSRMPGVRSLELDCSEGGELDVTLARSLASMAPRMSSVDLNFRTVQSAALPFLGPLKCTALLAGLGEGPLIHDGAVLANWKDTLRRFDMGGTAVQEVPCVMPHMTALAYLNLRPDANALNALAANLPSLQAVHLRARGNWAGMRGQRFAPLAGVKRAEVIADKESCGVPLVRLVPNVEALFYSVWGPGVVRLPSLAGLTALRSLEMCNRPLTKGDAEAIAASAPRLTTLACAIAQPTLPAIGALSGLRGLGTLILEVWGIRRGGGVSPGVADALLAVTALAALTCLAVSFPGSEAEGVAAAEEEPPSLWEAVRQLAAARAPLRLLQVDTELTRGDFWILDTLRNLRTIWSREVGGRLKGAFLHYNVPGATPEGPVRRESVIPP